MSSPVFRHSIDARVRSYEVDWQGIVHNAIYLQYFEAGRLEYLRASGTLLDADTVKSSHRIVVVRNEINYRSPARYDEMIRISTRIQYIRNSSFAFEGLIEETGSGRVVADGIAVHVWLDGRTGEPVKVPDGFRRKIALFEGSEINFRPQTGFA